LASGIPIAAPAGPRHLTPTHMPIGTCERLD